MLGAANGLTSGPCSLYLPLFRLRLSLPLRQVALPCSYIYECLSTHCDSLRPASHRHHVVCAPASLCPYATVPLCAISAVMLCGSDDGSVFVRHISRIEGTGDITARLLSIAAPSAAATTPTKVTTMWYEPVPDLLFTGESHGSHGSPG